MESVECRTGDRARNFGFPISVTIGWFPPVVLPSMAVTERDRQNREMLIHELAVAMCVWEELNPTQSPQFDIFKCRSILGRTSPRFFSAIDSFTPIKWSVLLWRHLLASTEPCTLETLRYLRFGVQEFTHRNTRWETLPGVFYFFLNVIPWFVPSIFFFQHSRLFSEHFFPDGI